MRQGPLQGTEVCLDKAHTGHCCPPPPPDTSALYSPGKHSLSFTLPNPVKHPKVPSQAVSLVSLGHLCTPQPPTQALPAHAAIRAFSSLSGTQNLNPHFSAAAEKSAAHAEPPSSKWVFLIWSAQQSLRGLMKMGFLCCHFSVTPVGAAL